VAKKKPAKQPAKKAAKKTTIKEVSAKARAKRPSLADKLGQRTEALADKSGLQPTEEQQAIIEMAREVVDKNGVMICEAGAGTGKTSTFRMIADAIPKRGQYTAFNTSLVRDSSAKFQGTRVSCSTTHSLAFRTVGKQFAARLEGRRVKSAEIAARLGISEFSLEVNEQGKRLAAGWQAGRVMEAIRRFCQSADPELKAGHFRYVDGLDPVDSEGSRGYANNLILRDRLLPYAKRAWTDLTVPNGSLPFFHDVYVKMYQLGSPEPMADYGLLDEHQDTAGVVISIIKTLIEKGMPWILVGDACQQIYEWRGALNAAEEFPDAPKLWLTQSFRFGPAIAEVANRILSTLQEPTKLRLKGFENINSVVGPIPQPLAILCRTNAVAVASIINGIAEGKRPFLVGGGAEVVSFVEAARQLQQGLATDHPELACFSSWTEVQQYVKEDEADDLKLLVKLIDSFGAEEILKALKNMPQEKDSDLVVSTAHKSKGREWKTVRLASDFPTADKATDSDRKLLYVAATRAKEGLDLADCPFFTGKDSPDLSAARAFQRPDADENPVAPPAPSDPPAPTQYTWAKGREGDWLVRGPSGHAGETVPVIRKDGSRCQRRLGKPVWSEGSVALYQ